MLQSSRFLHRFPSALLCCLVLLGLTSARAQYSISVTNYDFETDGLADGEFSNNPGVIPTGWTAVTSISGAYYGYYNPINAAYSGTDDSGTNGTMSGPNAFYFGSAVNNEGIQQTVGATFAANIDYYLTVAVGTRSGNLANTAQLGMQLLAGSTVIASSTVRNTTADSFTDFTLHYDPVVAGSTYSSFYGQAVTIRFVEIDTSFSGEMDIDNVRLTFIPEPSTTALIAGAVGLVGAAFWRRRRRAPAQA